MNLYGVKVVRVVSAEGLIAAPTRDAAEALAIADAKHGHWDFGYPEFSAESSFLLTAVGVDPAKLSPLTEVVVGVGQVAALGEWLEGQKP